MEKTLEKKLRKVAGALWTWWECPGCAYEFSIAEVLNRCPKCGHFAKVKRQIRKKAFRKGKTNAGIPDNRMAETVRVY